MGEQENKIMDFVNEQFKMVNQKLDKLTELTEQTHMQEYRLNQIERKLDKMEKSKTDNLWKVFTPILSAIISAVMTFVIAGGLRK